VTLLELERKDCTMATEIDLKRDEKNEMQRKSMIGASS
jgi:hypothetical protein